MVRPRLKPLCPAAAVLAGPDGTGPSIVCRALRADHAQVDSIVEGGTDGALLPVRKEGTVVLGFCCGKALPVVDAPPAEGKAHHTCCPVWRAEKERIAAGEDRLAGGYVPPTPPLGMTEIERRQDVQGLDELVGDKA